MRSRPSIWLLVSVMLFVTGACCWRLGNKRAAERAAAPSLGPHAQTPVSRASGIMRTPPVSRLSQPGAIRSPPTAAPLTHHASRITHPLSLRLSNTPASLSQLLRRPTAILLENALLDTAQPAGLSIPDHLRAHGDPGAYMVQSRVPLDDAFRAGLSAAGADIVAYIPNQAYLVRASQAVAQQLQADPRTQAVVPYEPYFKLKPPLLALAVEQQLLPENQALNLLLFPDARSAALDALNNLGVQVLAEERSPFGPVLKVQTGSAGILPALAGLASVQEVELFHTRVLANDLTLARIAVTADTITPENCLGLTGSNV